MRLRLVTNIVLTAALLSTLPALAQAPALPLRAGIIGCDTSHVMAFYNALSKPDAEGDLRDVKIVAAFPGGSADIPSSADRVEKFTQALREKGVEIVPTIDELVKRVDVVFLESVDGRPHLAQARPVIAAGKPLFVDKPMAGTLPDVLEIFRLAKEKGTPVFSSSSLRYETWLQEARTDPKVGPIRGCDAWSPCSLEEHHPDLFWYGIHGVEMLFAVMGTGCKTVTRVQTENTELVVGVWEDGRVGTFRGLRDGKRDYGAMVFGTKANVLATGKHDYLPLVREICQFFKTGKPPVVAEETIEMFAFMEAADESKRQGGCPVTIESVLAKARAAAAK